MSWRLAVFGAGGCAADLLSTIEDEFARVAETRSDAGHLVFVESDPSDDYFFGHRIRSLSALLDEDHVDETLFVVAVGSPLHRSRLHLLLRERGFVPASLHASSANISPHASIGEGAVFAEFTNVPSNAVVGRSFQCNYFSYVAHDVVVGDFVTFAPRVGCNGNVVIGDNVMVGAGAIIRPGTKSHPLEIGSGAVIGMGAVVTQHVPAGVTVLGNPARVR